MEEATHVDDDALLALLAPWFDLLKRDGAYLPRREPEAHWRAQNETSLIWLAHRADHRLNDHPNTMEAIELLVLLARVDWQLWKRASKMIWPGRSSDYEDLFDSRPMDVGIIWDLAESPAVADRLRSHLVVSRVLPQSDTFLSAKEAIQRRATPGFGPVLPIAVRLKNLRQDAYLAQGTALRFLVVALQLAAVPEAEVAVPLKDPRQL